MSDSASAYYCTRCVYEYWGVDRCPIHGDAARPPADEQPSLFPGVEPKPPRPVQVSHHELRASLYDMEPVGDGAWDAHRDYPDDDDEWGY